MLRLTCVYLLLLACHTCFSQTEITWKTLSHMNFVETYDAEEDMPAYDIEFSPKLESLRGKEVFIKGFMLVIAAEDNVFILSKNPFSACFFCGNAGPESIVELQVKPDHPAFDMDQIVVMKGILKLNKADLDHCNYILEAAEVYKP